jgi:hypothetical protein
MSTRFEKKPEGKYVKAVHSGKELYKFFRLQESDMVGRALQRLCELYGDEFEFATCYDEDGTGIMFSFEQGSWIYTGYRNMFKNLYYQFHNQGTKFEKPDTTLFLTDINQQIQVRITDLGVLYSTSKDAKIQYELEKRFPRMTWTQYEELVLKINDKRFPNASARLCTRYSEIKDLLEKEDEDMFGKYQIDSNDYGLVDTANTREELEEALGLMPDEYTITGPNGSAKIIITGDEREEGGYEVDSIAAQIEGDDVVYGEAWNDGALTELVEKLIKIIG